ncbi:MAG: hypothetical protein HQM15_09645 [Deltaproteobacteria bacterium]|nr:hypothetical protein [Deltaproteobacteria bacterium]
MRKIPIIISVLLLIVSGFTVWWVSNANLTPSEHITSIISIITCLGALISATIVVYSYLQANMAFVESKRPQLLIQVVNLHPQVKNQVVDVTRIHYKNITNNRFADLTIHVAIIAQNREFEFDLSNLFTARMVMVGQDQRQRDFVVNEELQSRGLNINVVASQGIQVVLKIFYEHTYQGAKDLGNVQDYVWNASKREWHIA